MEREWTTVDKTGWGDGPWNDEPDKLQWVDGATGFDCLVKRGPLGNLCGYVGVPPGHPCHGKHYDEVSVFDAEEGCSHPLVHGGLTYSARCAETDDESKGICHVPEPGRPADVWWLGFDCGHGFDVCPAADARSLALGLPSLRFGEESYKPIPYVRAECAKLAEQLAVVR